MKTDAEIYRAALERLIPAAEYGASVAGQIKLKGFSTMVVAVREARNALALGQLRTDAWRGGKRECRKAHEDGRCGCGGPESADPPGYCAVQFGGDR